MIERVRKAAGEVRLARDLNRFTGKDGWTPGRKDYPLRTRMRWTGTRVLCTLLFADHWRRPDSDPRYEWTCRICRTSACSFEEVTNGDD